MGSTNKPLTARQRDNKLRWLYYRPHISTGAMLALLVVTSGLVTRRQHLLVANEWEDIPFQQAEAPCVRSYTMSDQYSYWWVNTYLIEGEKQSVISYKGCTAGRQYSIEYRIGKTGYMDIGKQTEVTSAERK